MRAWAWAALVAAVLAAGWWAVEHFKGVGYAECEADNAAAIETVQRELRVLRAERAAERERYERELAGVRGRERAAVVGDPPVAAWWRTPVPRCAAAYAYGRVYEGCPGAVRPGP